MKMLDAQYFDKFTAHDDPLLTEIERTSAERDIPIVGPAVGKLLYLLVKLSGARRILELGTANGYSAVWLAKAAGKGSGITTLEWSEDMAAEARQNIERAGYSNQVKVVVGDAKKYLKSLEANFDMVFMDIEKELYSAVLPDCARLLRSKGILIADNVAFSSSGDFNESLYNNPELETAFIYGIFSNHSPDEDALSLSVKK